MILRRSQIDTAVGDLSNLMKQATIKPHDQGIQISNIRPRSIFRRMGLRSGDVITSVDGNELTSVDDGLQLYDSLKSSSSLTVDILRLGRPETIEYEIK